MGRGESGRVRGPRALDPSSRPGLLLTSTSCSTCRPSVTLSGLGVMPGAHCTTRGTWKGEGGWGRDRGSVSHCRGLGWRSEVRAGVSPDSWDSGAPGHKKAHRSRPPCRRDPGKAGGWAGHYGPSLSLSSYLQPMPAWTPNLLLFPKPLFPGTPMVLSPTEPHFALHTAGPLDQKHHLVTEALLILFKIANPCHFPCLFLL